MSDAALARVHRLLAAGRRIVDPRDALGIEARDRLPASSGLSAAGVELALREHFETAPSDDELRRLLGAVGVAERCHLVLSANVCTAALRALALALATAAEVAVRPSRRDPVVAELLVRALADDAQAVALGVRVDTVREVAPAPGDELHVYGSDATIAAFRRGEARVLLPPGVVLRGHGTGLGVAAVEAGTDLDAAAAALARDVVPFDQQGCLSPRFAFVAGGAARAEHLATALTAELRRLGEPVPRGALAADEEQAIAAWAQTMRAVGDVDLGAHHGVAVDVAPQALLLPPAARIVCVLAADAPALGALLSPLARHLAATGVASSVEPALHVARENEPSGALAAALRTIAPRARRSPIGSMQRPPLDGPVDLRTEVVRIP